MEMKFSSELYGFITAGDLENTRGFLSSHPEFLHAETPFGSWLDIAAGAGQLEIVRLLVSLGLDVNRINHHNLRPIKEAADGGHSEVVAFLLANGATTALYDRDAAANPLFGAIHSKSPDVARLLLAHGSDASIDYGNGKTAVSFALLHGAVEVADVIAEYLAAGDPEEKSRILATDKATADRQGKLRPTRILPSRRNPKTQ